MSIKCSIDGKNSIHVYIFPFLQRSQGCIHKGKQYISQVKKLKLKQLACNSVTCKLFRLHAVKIAICFTIFGMQTWSINQWSVFNFILFHMGQKHKRPYACIYIYLWTGSLADTLNNVQGESWQKHWKCQRAWNLIWES